MMVTCISCVLPSIGQCIIALRHTYSRHAKLNRLVSAPKLAVEQHCLETVRNVTFVQNNGMFQNMLLFWQKKPTCLPRSDAFCADMRIWYFSSLCPQTSKFLTDRNTAVSGHSGSNQTVQLFCFFSLLHTCMIGSILFFMEHVERWQL